MTIQDERVLDVPTHCPYCGGAVVCDNPSDNWRVCVPCEVAFIEPEPCEVMT